MVAKRLDIPVNAKRQRAKKNFKDITRIHWSST